MNMKKLLACAFLGLLAAAGVKAQTQMLLPYNDLAFQSSWANAAVRPMHRFSIGVPVLSSIEVGLINNAFSLRSVSELRGSTRFLLPDKLSSEMQNYKTSQEYFEMGIDILHFRMAWRRWFFWFGWRNQTTQSLVYPTELVRLGVEGNKWLVGNRLDMNDLRFDLTNYNELTLGASHPYEDWIFGGRISFLGGSVNGNLVADNLGLTITEENEKRFAHIIDQKGVLRTSGLPIENGEPKLPDYKKVGTYINFTNPGFALSGAATYILPQDNRFRFTFAFTDLGMIHWGQDLGQAKLKEDQSWVMGLSGFNTILFRKKMDWGFLSSDNFKKQFHMDLDEQNTKGESYNTWLSPKFYLMGTYRLARQTHAGLSAAMTVHQGQVYPSFTASIQQGYSALFSGQLAVSYNQRSFLNFGGALVFSPGAYQFYLITDNLYGLLNPIDLKATNLRIGMNIVIGPLYPNSQLTQK